MNGTFGPRTIKTDEFIEHLTKKTKNVEIIDVYKRQLLDIIRRIHEIEGKMCIRDSNKACITVLHAILG